MLVQVLVDCVKANGTNGCNGGDPTAAYSYILDHGIPDETCSNYEVSSPACHRLPSGVACGPHAQFVMCYEIVAQKSGSFS